MQRRFALSYLLYSLLFSVGLSAAEGAKPTLAFEMTHDAHKGTYRVAIFNGPEKHSFMFHGVGESLNLPKGTHWPNWVTYVPGHGLEIHVGPLKFTCSPKKVISIPNTFLSKQNIRIKAPNIIVEGYLTAPQMELVATDSFINRGWIEAGKCTIASPAQGSFKQKSAGARIDCAGDLILDFPGGTIDNHQGTLSALGNITITAHELNNYRTDGDYDSNDSPAAIMAFYGNITLKVDTLTNQESILYANNNMSLAFKKLYNKTRTQTNKDNLRARPSYAREGYDIGLDTRPLKAHTQYKVDFRNLVPSLIWCGNTMELEVEGSRKVFRKNTSCERLPGVENTGLLGSGALFDLEAGQVQSCLVNGITDERVRLAQQMFAVGDELQPLATPLWLIASDGVQKCFEKTDPTVYRHFLSPCARPVEYQPYNIPLYAHKPEDVKTLSPDEKLLLPRIPEAEAAFRSLFYRTGSPLLPGQRNFLTQLHDLKEDGILVALANGNVVPRVKDIATSAQEEALSKKMWQDMDAATERQVFESQAKEYRLNNKRTGFDFFHRKRLYLTGNYWLTLPKLDNKSCPQVSFFYHQFTKRGQNETSLTPAIFVCASDYKGTFHPEGILKADEAHIDGKHLKVINTGSLVTAKKLYIKAESFINQKLMRKTDKTVPEGFSSRRKYTIRTPQEGTGIVLGLDIEITADQDVINKGGDIKATHNVRLVSVHGDVINTYELAEEIIKWKPGFWGKVLGKESSSKAATFVAGKIEGEEGDVTLLSEAGKVLNLASTIIAGQNATLDGFMGVLTSSCAEVHKAKEKAYWSGLSIKSVMREAANVGMARIIAHHGNIRLKSKGIVTDRGTAMDAHGNLLYEGEQGNTIESPPVTTHSTESTTGLGGHEDKDSTAEHKTSPAKKAGGDILFTTKGNNVIEVEDLIAGNNVRFSAGGKNVIKGVTRCYKTKTGGWSFRATAFGIPILQPLFEENWVGSIKALGDSDPFVRAFIATIASDEPIDAAYRGAFTAAEFVRLIDQITSNGKKAGTIRGLIAQRIGLSADGTSFSPTINFRLGRHQGQDCLCITTQPTIHAKGFEASSGQDSSYTGLKFDGTKTVTIRTKGDLNLTPGSTVSTKAWQYDAGVSVAYIPGVGITGVGVDGNYSSDSSHTRPVIKVVAKTTNITVGKDMKILNYVLGDKGATVNITVKGNCIIGTNPDDDYRKQYAGSLFVGLDGKSGSVGYSSAHDKKIQVIAQGGIAKGTKINIKVDGKLTLQGALIDGFGEIKAKELEVFDIQVMDKHTKTDLGMSLIPHDVIPIAGGFTLDHVDPAPGVIHSVVGPKIKLTITKGVPKKLKRDTSKARTMFKPVDEHWRIPFFYINFDRLREINQQWRDARDDYKRQQAAKAAFEEEMRRARQAWQDAQKQTEHQQQEAPQQDSSEDKQPTSERQQAPEEHQQATEQDTPTQSKKADQSGPHQQASEEKVTKQPAVEQLPTTDAIPEADQPDGKMLYTTFDLDIKDKGLISVEVASPKPQYIQQQDIDPTALKIVGLGADPVTGAERLELQFGDYHARFTRIEPLPGVNYMPYDPNYRPTPGTEFSQSPKPGTTYIPGWGYRVDPPSYWRRYSAEDWGDAATMTISVLLLARGVNIPKEDIKAAFNQKFAPHLKNFKQTEIGKAGGKLYTNVINPLWQEASEAVSETFNDLKDVVKPAWQGTKESFAEMREDFKAAMRRFLGRNSPPQPAGATAGKTECPTGDWHYNNEQLPGQQYGGGSSNRINPTDIAILKNGYYEVNGFKFSKYYYEKVWSTGRGGPSLVANEILKGTQNGVADSVKAGFYRYEFGGWEMVYNPITKEVWHLQPLSKGQ